MNEKLMKRYKFSQQVIGLTDHTVYKVMQCTYVYQDSGGRCGGECVIGIDPESGFSVLTIPIVMKYRNGKYFRRRTPNRNNRDK